MTFYNRADFNIYYLTLSGKTRKERAIEINKYLSSLYPKNPLSKNIFVCKNGHGKNWIVAVNNSTKDGDDLELSTIYVAHKLSNFTGIVAFISNVFIELIEMNQGCIISSHYYKEMPDAVFRDAKIIYLYHTDIDKSYFGDRFVHIIRISDKYNPIVFRRILVLILSLTVFIFIIMFSRFSYKNYKLKQEEQINAIRNKQILDEREKQKQSQIDYCKLLQQKYTDFCTAVPLQAYSICSLIYKCMDTSCIIKTLSINGNTFQVELQCYDSLKILKNFETINGLYDCCMERSAVEQGTNLQTCTINGKAFQQINLPSFKSIDDKIIFLQNANTEIEQERTKHSQLTTADAAMKIRTLLKNNSCFEEYFQRVTDGTYTEFEIGIRGSSKSILSFIQSCSNKWDFRSVRIKNYTDQNSVSCTFKIITWIPQDKPATSSSYSTEQTISPNIISDAFSKKLPVINQTSPHIKAVIPSSTEQILRVDWLVFIGTGIIDDGRTMLFIKNIKTGDILQINEFSKTDNGNYLICIDNKQYEVQK